MIRCPRCRHRLQEEVTTFISSNEKQKKQTLARYYTYRCTNCTYRTTRAKDVKRDANDTHNQDQ